jgi:hypothetical protein
MARYRAGPPPFGVPALLLGAQRTQRREPQLQLIHHNRGQIRQHRGGLADHPGLRVSTLTVPIRGHDRRPA